MNVIINGEKKTLSPNSTIEAALHHLELPKSFVVEYNGDIINPDTYQSHILKEDDALEIIRFVGGG